MPNNNTSTPSVKTSNKTIPPATILLQGYLMKQKHGKCRAWLKRYFVLYGGELRKYSMMNDNTTLAVISLDHYSIVPDAQPLTALNQKQWKYNTFCLVSDDESKHDWPDYFLQASSDEERLVWVDKIQKHVSQSKSILDKWLERLELPSENIPVIPDFPTNDQELDDKSGFLSSESNLDSVSRQYNNISDIVLPLSKNSNIPMKQSSDSQSISSYTSVSEIASPKRRPSDFASGKNLSEKLFFWNRSKSSETNLSEASELTLTAGSNDSNDFLATPKVVLKSLESPIIHPSEYENDEKFLSNLQKQMAQCERNY
ncbi:hypothetical protein K501DRAFT_239101 [Backusella circina FSU 941]|nr:hypothetical protein K501DRAFT_239101 [Backusella circina FSU 941]